MKKTAMLACLMLAFGAACADDLADAQKLWENKKFTEAFQAFNKLAQAGNPAAQLQLGEMYGFGEGTAEDMAQATQWLEKAQKAGVKEAAGSLDLVRRRAAHKADIAWYTDKFDGADARYEKFGCVAPDLPEVSKTIRAIKAADADIKTWRECYGRFASNLNSKAQITNTIPANVLDLMNQDEFNRASTHIGAVYTEIGTHGQAVADAITKKTDAWHKATSEYVVAYDKQNQAEMKRIQIENDIETKRLQTMNQSSIIPKITH